MSAASTPEVIYRITTRDTDQDNKVVSTILFRDTQDRGILKFIPEVTTEVENIFASYKDETHIHEVDFVVMKPGDVVEANLEDALKKVQSVAEDLLTCDLDA